MNAFPKLRHTIAQFYPKVDSTAKNVLLRVVLSLSIVANANAQFQRQDYSSPSPNAASLGLNGEVPVSLYTGLPNIEIPIYTIEQGNLKVPITLSYHASGVRVNQHPGWVGLNWNLNAGGAITRKVNDKQDEFMWDERFPQTTIVGYYHNYGLLDREDWETSAAARDYNIRAVDTQPDEFKFQFLNYSGSFFLDHKGTWVVKSASKIRIEVDNNLMSIPNELTRSCGGEVGITFPTPTTNNPKTLGKFTLITDNGTRYEFGGTTQAIEYSIPFFGQRHINLRVNDVWSANTWYLTKITSPEGQTISFNYEVDGCSDGKYIANFFPSYSTTAYRADFSSGVFNISCSSSSLSVPASGFYQGALVRPSYLKSISSDIHNINFNRSTTNELKYESRMLTKYFQQSDIMNVNGDVFPFLNYNADLGGSANNRIENLISKLVWKKLDNIEVYDKNNSLTNKATFGYSGSSAKRLTLESLSFIKVDEQSCENKHTFDYYNDYTLPNYLDASDKTDHWGFFNNREFNLETNLVANFSGFVSQKESSNDLSILKSGTLSKITYPTGGTAEFEYQPHSAYKYRNVSNNGSISLLDDGSQVIGGLRIFKIKNRDNVSSDTKIKEYTYSLADGRSSGISTGKPVYISSDYNMAAINDNGVRTQTVYSLQNLLPMSVNAQGSHIGYSRVTEKNSDNSYKVTTFSNFESTDGANHNDEAVAANLRIAGSSGSRYEPYIDKSFERGLVETEEVYNSGNSPILKKKFFYRSLSNEFVRAIFNVTLAACPGSYVNVGSGFPYRIYTYKYVLDRQEVTFYDQADGNRTTQENTNYVSYNTDGLPTEVRTTRGDKFTVTKNKYSGDYDADPCGKQLTACQGECYGRGLGQPCLSTCQSQYDYCRNNNNETQSVALQTMLSRGVTGILVERQIWNNDSGPFGLTNATLNLYKSFNANAGTINVKPEKTVQYTGTVPNTSAQLSSIKVFGPNKPYLSYDLGYTREIVKYGDYTTRGEPINITDQNGLTTTLSYHGGANTGSIHQKTVGNQTTTYNYRPLIGLSEINDPNGFNTKYYYDGFNRLQYVRDHWNNLLQSYTYNLSKSTGCGTKPSLAIESVNTLSVSPASSNVVAGGGSPNFTVNSTVSWNVSGLPSWARVSSSTGTGFVLTVDANAGGTRQASITVAGPGGSPSQLITLNQAGVQSGGGDCYVVKNKFSNQYWKATSTDVVRHEALVANQADQLWKLELVTGNTYKIISQSGSANKVMYVDQASNGQPVRLGAYQADSRFQWLRESLADGSYRFSTGSVTMDQAGAASQPELQLYGNTSDELAPYRQFILQSATCPGGCVQPTLSLGTPTCTGTGYYTVSFTVPANAYVTTTAGIVQGNQIINVPVGTNATITATLNGCSAQQLASSPVCGGGVGECFTIKNQSSGHYLQAMTDNTVQHVSVASGQPEQIWKIETADGGLRISSVSAPNKIMYVNAYNNDQQVRLGTDVSNEARYRWIKEVINGTSNYRVRSGVMPWAQQYAGTQPQLQIWGDINVAPQINNPAYIQFIFQSVGCPN
ncbi:RICIN domain-containing protein [uncultured Fibrella sp.]|uniref:RICIN domain-containing protein n=1 Tax=uncultured Fibrella sp. TaxID=1284596 RepID=UPI0035CB0507